MSVQGTPQLNTPALQQIPQQQPAQAAPGPYRTSLFDSFQMSGTQPRVHAGLFSLAKSLAFHPIKTLSGLKNLPTVGSEKRLQRLKMYFELRQALGREGRANLKNLMKHGVLNDAKTDDGHSTLYQLYAMLKTRRATGLDNKKILNEAVRILNRPYLITQKFGKLSETNAQQILHVRNNPGLNRAGEMPTFKPLAWEDLNVEGSATCVASSVMYYMADKEPAELARHLNELTSPASAFYEKVKLSELSPGNPQDAYRILQEHNIRYKLSGADEVMVKVDLPQAGMIRTINNSQQGVQDNVRTGVETAYQSALTFLATKSYDPATDFRDAENPGETSKGLTEPEKTLMENIIKDNGGVQSITYQVVGAKSNPAPGEEGLPFLYGYTRGFDQTARDIIEALEMGEFVIIGITDTDEAGSIAGGHEITITSAFVDQQDGELKFVVADSDDDVPTPVVRSARELIPRIHHAGMPLKQAEKIQNEIQQVLPQNYYVPTQADLTSFEPIPFIQDPISADQMPDPSQDAAAAAAQTEAVPQQPTTVAPQAPQPAQGAQQAAQPQYVVDYVPVPNNAPYGWAQQLYANPAYPQQSGMPWPGSYPAQQQPYANPYGYAAPAYPSYAPVMPSYSQASIPASPYGQQAAPYPTAPPAWPAA